MVNNLNNVTKDRSNVFHHHYKKYINERSDDNSSDMYPITTYKKIQKQIPLRNESEGKSSWQQHINNDGDEKYVIERR